MPIVLKYLLGDVLQGNPGGAEELFRFGGGVVPLFADHPNDAAVDNEHGTGPAGGHSTVEGGSLDTDSLFGRLTDSVLFGVDGTDAVLGCAAVFVGWFS